MKNDIVPRSKPVLPNAQPQVVPHISDRPVHALAQNATPIEPPNAESLPPIEEPPVGPPKPRKGRLKWYILGVLLTSILLAILAVGYLLSPQDSSSNESIPIEIVSGMVSGQIAQELEDKGLIRSKMAFLGYARLSGSGNSIKAGNYQLSPADSVPRILIQLQGGPDVDEIEVTFKPGETLAENKETLLSLGYSESEVDAAFSAKYDHPLFQDRPAGADLEGYVFGETHRFAKGTPVKEILKRYFDDYYAVIDENNLINLYKQQDLSLYEGIILASIIQRESGGDDKAQIAQVFLLRLSSGMPLGSDVTYQYIADKEGNPRDVNYDSPYNTRRYAGLPPGPIATPGVAALTAAGSPADGEYVYFLSGDDDITYFARTLAEHEANIRNHCQEKCTIL